MMYPAVSAVAAGPTASPPLPHALAIPTYAFPHGAVVRGTRVPNEQAARATGLHTIPVMQLGRLQGYEQQAQWRITVNRRTYSVSLQYEASMFASTGGAREATNDAQISLWETGRPLNVADVTVPVFLLRERGGVVTLAVVFGTGPLESELLLRYHGATGSPVQQRVLQQISHLWTIASGVNARLAASLPTVPATTALTPDVFEAPSGTGPVIKSPSLMVLDSSLVGTAGMQLTGGAYRSSSPPPRAARSHPNAALVSLGQLSRYVELARTSARDDIYDSASLFADTTAARNAYDTLARSNDALRLKPFPLTSGTDAPARLTATDTFQAWRQGTETVLAVLWQNVVMVVAQRGPDPIALPPLADRLLSTVPSWLHAQGTQMVDGANVPMHLAGLNWYGAEQQDYVVGGLDYEPYQSILWAIKRAGYNTVRLPFSDQMVEQNPVIMSHVRANPELAGLHALDICDHVIAYAGAIGLSVILDNHRSDAGWSSQESGLWYTPDYPESAFDRDWATMARRYAATNVVVGADLRNEPHGTASWGTGDPATDWRLAAQRAGDRVLMANRHLLIMVEGVQYYGAAPSYWWGGNLMGVATAPVSLQFADGTPARSQLVYSTHDYGVDNCSSGCPWFNTTTSYASLAAVWDQYWGYITADATRPYAAPVWVGEFGTCNYNPTCVSNTAPGSQGQWFQSLVQYIGGKHLSWAYWSANATQSTGGTRTYGTLDWYGYFQQDWVAPVPWLTSALKVIQSDTGTTALPAGHSG